MDLREQKAGGSDVAWGVHATGVIHGNVHGNVSGPSEHLLGPSVVGRDDVRPEKG